MGFYVPNYRTEPVSLLTQSMPLPRLSPLLLLLVVAPLSAQDETPAGLAALETDRSTTCVDALSRLEVLDAQLEPLAIRADRLLGIAGAITVEEGSVVDSLDVSDPVEAAVAEWFRADAALAQRYLTEQSQEILDQRAAGKEAIRTALEEALKAVQAQADSVVAPTGNLRARGVTCSGTILIRGPALQACSGLTSRVCEAARDSTIASPFRFAASADLLWGRQEFLPWSAPTALQASQDGQLNGAQTVGYTRAGNVAVSLSFNPVLRARDELAPEELAAIDSINAVLGIESTHPDVTFAPALAIQANLPKALGGESHYLLHFGTSESPDIIWTGDADTGAAIGGTVALAPEHLDRLRAGEAMTLTAIRENEAGEVEAVYALELSALNQAARVEALLSYMRQRLSADLIRLIPPTN